MSLYLQTSLEPLNLKAILKSSAITKVFFDVRNDSDAHYATACSLPALKTELMETAARLRMEPPLP